MAVLDDSTSALAWDECLDRAVAASRTFAQTSPQLRATALRAIAAAIETHADDLLPVAVAETGLGTERLAGEIARTADQFRLYADVVEEGSWAAVSIDSAKPPFDDHRRMNVAVGPVLVFAASNFPFAFGVLGTDTASALAAGCSVIAKPHPGHPMLGQHLAQLINTAAEDAGIPAGLFTLVTGSDAAIRVLRDDRVEAGSFTGSIGGGTSLLAIAQARQRPIPFFAEMGSSNPVVVTPAAWAARSEEIVRGLVSSMTQSNGQLCTSPGIVFVPTDLRGDRGLTEVMGATTAAPMLTDAIANSFNTGMVELSVAPGVTPLSPVRIMTDRSAHPMLWGSDTSTAERDPDILKEHFGPSSVMVHYDTMGKVLEIIDKLDGQLTGSIFSVAGEDISTLIEAMSRKVGRLLNNAWPTGVAVSWSMHHGGPWPATSARAHGSVGAESIARFIRPITYQNFPESALPSALKNSNPWNLPRRIDGLLVGAA
jgi:NADP-dependent aldehyde dehydrogenase